MIDRTHENTSTTIENSAGHQVPSSQPVGVAEWFRRHWAGEIPFNLHVGMTVRQWGPDLVEIELPYDESLSAHEGVLHGGMIAALVDTTATGAVIAGHDFRKGSRASTISMTISYMASAPFEGVIASGHALHRGGRLHHAEVTVTSTSGALLARGSVIVSISGKRAGAPDIDSDPDVGGHA
jgi:uncharacterized protein (TIGR00369 family)